MYALHGFPPFLVFAFAILIGYRFVQRLLIGLRQSHTIGVIAMG
jgi:hypothetical protein